MTSRSDLESAIMDAETAAAVLTIIETELTSSIVDGWRSLRLEPREDLNVIVLSPTERRALDYASRNLVDAVVEVSRVFYGMTGSERL